MTEPTRLTEKCPACGSAAVGREAVDIGVGTLYGPLGCYDCGWSEPRADVLPDGPDEGDGPW